MVCQSVARTPEWVERMGGPSCSGYPGAASDRTGELAGAPDGFGLSDLAGSSRDHRAGRDCAAELQAPSAGVAREVLKHHMIASVPTFQDNLPDFDCGDLDVTHLRPTA